MHDIDERHIKRLLHLNQQTDPADPSSEDGVWFEMSLVEEDDGGNVSISSLGRQVGQAMTADPNEGAAWLIWCSLRAYTGRRLKVDRYRALAAPALERRRLSQSKYEAVLRAGERIGILKIDDTSGAYPFLLAMDLPEPESKAEPDPEFDSEIEPETDLEFEHVSKPIDPYVPLVPDAPSDDWNPPKYLDCGHMNGSDEATNDAARAKGFCCYGGEEKRSVNHRRTHGEYCKPVPMNLRYSKEKAAMGGFPGLVCDDDGYYVSDIVNQALVRSKV